MHVSSINIKYLPNWAQLRAWSMARNGSVGQLLQLQC